MTTDHDNLTPQQRLAKIVAEVTDDGRRVVQFFMQVADGKLDHEDFKPNHRMDAAKELVKIGLTEFADYVPPAKPRAPRRKSASTEPGQLSPEIEQAREELAKYARELTGDGKTVIRLYSEVMDGFRNDEGFKPHHRIAAGRELLLRGFGPVSSWTQPEPAQAEPQITDHHQNQTNHSSDQSTLTLTPTASEYLSDAVEAYEERGNAQTTAAPECPGHHRQRRASGRCAHACHSRGTKAETYPAPKTRNVLTTASNGPNSPKNRARKSRKRPCAACKCGPRCSGARRLPPKKTPDNR